MEAALCEPRADRSIELETEIGLFDHALFRNYRTRGKLQGNSNLQAATFAPSTLLVLESWCLPGIWCLAFGISATASGVAQKLNHSTFSEAARTLRTKRRRHAKTGFYH
jgi:hypothetical protein